MFSFLNLSEYLKLKLFMKKTFSDDFFIRLPEMRSEEPRFAHA